MVNDPVDTVFETEDPEMVPCNADVNTATFAGPPAACPAIAFAKSIKNAPIPVFSKNAPNKINRKM